MTQSQEIINKLIERIQRALKQEKRGLITENEAFNACYNTISGVELALQVLEPESVFIVLPQLKKLVTETYAGTTEQNENARKQLMNAKI